ncbi:MAG: AAA family ATPase [Pleomorphochaeta sp.]
MNIFFGKFGSQFPEQIEKHFYAGGAKQSKWYGDVEIGDYVFPIHNGLVSEIWVAKKFDDNYPNQTKEKQVLLFDVIKEFEEISVNSIFLRYKFFNLDINMINKSVKSAEKGFFKITPEIPINNINDIDFEQIRKIYIVDKDIINKIDFLDRDIRILIDVNEDCKILKIEEFILNQFIEYKPLLDLYNDRNKINERYNLKQLHNFAQIDNAPNKLRYLENLITELNEKQFFIETNPVRLYDNVLVGRKKTKSNNSNLNNSHSVKNVDINTEEVDEKISDLIQNYDQYNKLISENPNLILYGPPGTGKTYTAQRLIELIEYKATKKFNAFESLMNEERVQFITFHQSYSYEEFVEGIRPVFSEVNDNNPSIKYELHNGIIKKLVNIANLFYLNENIMNNKKAEISKNNKIYKISLGSRNVEKEIYDNCKENSCIAIGWLGDIDLSGYSKEDITNKINEISDDNNLTQSISSIDLFVNELNIGDIVCVYDGPYTIRDIGIITGNYMFDKKNIYNYPHRRSVKWIKEFDEPYNIADLNSGVKLTLKTLYPLYRMQFSDLKEIMFSDDGKKIEEEKNIKPCYLIIDEINRGNISKIFGELITLIEKDKRDTLSITLPYSQKPFKLPSNLYIIGTMNTADRSIAILDTALRRRFTFVEIEPNPELFSLIGDVSVEDKINLTCLLKSLNQKIVKYYDRDHRIGHSYFLNISSFSQFKNIWNYKIIPLLMDYFYNDFQSISKIIGEDFFDPELNNIKSLSDEKLIIAIKKIYEKN